jgi:hypothetical protein
MPRNCYAFGDLSFPSSQVPTTQKKFGVFDPTKKQTNKQTTRLLQTLLQRLQRDGIYERGRR